MLVTTAEYLAVSSVVRTNEVHSELFIAQPAVRGYIIAMTHFQQAKTDDNTSESYHHYDKIDD